VLKVFSSTRETLYTYMHIYKDGNPSTKSTRHYKANVNTQKENEDHQIPSK
jgi:hypothetical protein